MADRVDVLTKMIEGYACRYEWGMASVLVLFATPIGELGARQHYAKQVPLDQRSIIEPLARRCAIKAIIYEPDIIKRLELYV